MEIARCRAFLAAAEAGSLSKAAERLHYTPSGVSQLISALESELGFPLLKRTSRGVTLSPEGARLLPTVRALVLQESRLYELASEMNGLEIGAITIAAYSSIATHWLPPVIAAFRERYPRIKIDLREGVRQEVLRWMDEGSADIGFLSGGEDIKYEWLPLAEDPMIAVLPKTHPLAEAEEFPIARCREEQFIMPALGRDEDVVKLFARYGIEPDIVFSTNESFSAWAMVENGLGISITNGLLMQGWQCDVAKLPLSPPERITLGMIAPPFSQLSPSVRRFADFAAEKLRRL